MNAGQISSASARRYDVLSMGRNSVDLYANDIGVPVVDVKSYGAYVGGCPTNVAVGTHRLGLRSALLSRVGTEPQGDFILKFLNDEGVVTDFVTRDPEHLSGVVMLGILPPDHFPLTFYRENAADIHLDMDDVKRAPVEDSRLLFISGTGLSRSPSLAATLVAAERARAAGTTVMLDIDYRPTLWDDRRAFGPVLRLALALVDVAIGTEEEMMAAASVEDVEDAAALLLGRGTHLQALVVKQGMRGSTVHLPGGQSKSAPPFPVQVLNVLGAGDAFASGFIYAYLAGWDWYRCASFGNACGAIVVTRQACANSMPVLREVEEFMRKP